MIVADARLEVMQSLEPVVQAAMETHLASLESAWQPADLLPESTEEGFFDAVKELRSRAEGHGYDFWAVLIGDTITEEALPTYESWLMDVDGIEQDPQNPWGDWIRRWTAEENRHGDLLNRYLYLSGRVDMREMERSTHQVISEGFDIGTSRDPYKNFVYTSFQEMATNLSHRRVASLAKQNGDAELAKICGVIAGDEARHASAYRLFVAEIFQRDPSQMMLAFEYMMRHRIVMPASMLREPGGEPGDLFEHFSAAAHRSGIYTPEDYVDILDRLLLEWKIAEIGNLTPAAQQAQEYLLTLPSRLRRACTRLRMPEHVHRFRWIAQQ